jgi:IS1 family transposase
MRPCQFTRQGNPHLLNRQSSYILILAVLILVLELLRLKGVWKLLTKKRNSSAKSSKPRMLKVKTENDCPNCQAGGTQTVPPAETAITPYRETKGNGGRKKKICTQGYFCSNPDCYYYLVTDERIHALIGYGSHGKYESIPDLFCQACESKFTIRKHTLLYRLKTLSKVVCMAMSLLVLGIDVSALQEAMEIQESTLRTWLTRSGAQSRKLHQRFFKDLTLGHIQLDELWANVKQVQQDVWVWTVCEAKTKIIPVIQLGGRTQEMAYSVVHELKSRLKAGSVPVFSTDGLKHYFYALTAHFGEWVDVEGEKRPVWLVLSSFLHTQVIKQQRRFRLVGVEHRIIWGQPDEYRDRLKADGLSGKINTSYVERANLTIRQSVSKLTRRTWGPAQFTTELEDHLYWWLAYYHFVRAHESLRIRLAEPIQRKGRQRARQYQKKTPAMAAGITSRRWSVKELINLPLP